MPGRIDFWNIPRSDEGEIRTRPSEARVREAEMRNGVSTRVVACSKGAVMFNDALKTTSLEGLIELVFEALKRRSLRWSRIPQTYRIHGKIEGAPIARENEHNGR